MKTEQDVKNQLQLALLEWFPKQCANPLDSYYLYYQAATPEHNGGLLICKDIPKNPEWKLAWPEQIFKAKNVEQNFLYFMTNCCRKLPLLSV